MNGAAHGAVVGATRRATDTLIIVAAVLLIWQGLAQWVGSTALGRPRSDARLSRAFRSLRALCRQRALDRDHLRLGAVLIAYGLGLALGIWMGAHRLSGAVGEPILVTFYSLPKITLYPVILLIFGLTLAGKVTFGAIHGVLPVALLTMAAIRNIPPVYLKAARTMHLSPWQTIVYGAAAGDPAGSRRRLAHRLYRHAARRAAGGDVRLGKRPRLPDHQCHGICCRPRK